MAGSATYAQDDTVAGRARAMLDEISESVGQMDHVQRLVISQLVELWPDSGWLVAGARSAKDWLHTATGQSYREAARLEHIARLCTRNEQFADAVVDGRVSLGWAESLARVVTDDRAGFFTDEFVAAILGLVDAGASEDQFHAAVRYWRERVDEHVKPRRDQRHSLVASQRLFGGGEIHATLMPSAFETVMSAIDAFCQDPDPADAPHQRTYSERRADALDDMANYALTNTTRDELGDDTDTWDEDDDPIFDGATPDGSDVLDELLNTNDTDETDIDEPLAGLDALRKNLQKQFFDHERRTRRQTRPRSSSRVNVHIDLETLSGERGLTDFDGLVLRGDMWNLGRSAAELFLCDSTLVATLFAGNRILDANADAEQFSERQRRAIAARDRHCVFPSCRRGPRFCDAHHLHERDDGGPTIVDNGCLLCRFHHRLLHINGWSLRYDPERDLWLATDPHDHEWIERRPGPSAAA